MSPRKSNTAPPATPEMAARLAVNRAGRLTSGQRRTVLIAGGVALLLMLCPLALLVQIGALMLAEGVSLTLGTGLAALVVLGFFLFLAAIVYSNASMFLPEAFSARPVRYARGPLAIHPSEKDRPELPFSYIVGDYSFAPYVAPPDVPMRPGAPYLVYYSARSRLLLSLAALDAPDAAQWEPEFGPPPER